MYFFLKVLISAFVIAIVSELAKKYNLFAAIFASLPLTSILAFIWLYYETKDNAKIIDLSYSIFYLVLPSLIFFLVFPLLLRQGLSFYLSLFLSCTSMSIAYLLFIYFKKYFIG